VEDAEQTSWALFDSIPEMVVVVDLDGVLVYSNRHSLDLLGWTPAQLVGQAIEVLVPKRLHDVHRTHRSAHMHHPAARPMGSGLLLTALHRDGHEVPVEIALSPLGDGMAATVATIRDVSDRLEAAAQLEAARTRLEVLDDRDRIARELHDSVIQRLFAAGLRLQASMDRPDTSERISGVVDQIDEAIREIRGVIFTLHRPAHLDSGLAEALRASLDESARFLGHRPTLRIIGVLDAVADDLIAELLTVVRETLMNVAKHARATTTDVSIDVGSETITLVVADDGVGMPSSDVGQSGGLGVRNITERAARLGGHATFSNGASGGTEVRWTVPRLSLATPG
jgi:PAS domain S-box-containing protein